MRGKIIIAFLIMMLMITSSFVGAMNLKQSQKKSIINEDKASAGNLVTLGIGGWHNEATMEKDGRDTSNLEKLGGDGGGWEKPYEGNGVRIWAALNRVRASYTFNINEGPVKYVEYGVRYRDVGWFSDSPDAKIYKWNDNWDTLPNIGDHQGSYTWAYHTFDSNSLDYVNSNGEIRIAAQAFDDDNWFHQDDIAINKMKISYQAADEEIFLSNFNSYDSDDDRSVDSVEIKIDADVGDNGDGTTVEVSAFCELVDPEGNISDSDSVTWTIIDHQEEHGIVHLSSLGGINGDYSVNIELYDAFGNLESATSDTIFLEPDPQRTIVLQIDPMEGGLVNFSGNSYYDNETIQVSDGEYSVSAEPMEYFIFDQWVFDGGVSINPEDIYSQETQVTINDNGTLRAVFQFTLHEVYFFIVPDFAGSIIFAETTFENGSGVYASDGVFGIEAVSLDDNYYFYCWDVYGDINITDIYAYNTTVEISGDCIIVAYFIENAPPEKPEIPDGPITGATQATYTYSSSTFDIDGDDIYFLFDWGDGTDSGWKGPFKSYETVSESHKWAGSRVYHVKVMARDSFHAESEWSDSLAVGIFSPPHPPEITGPTTGKPNADLSFTISATDPDDEDVSIYIDWGDGNVENWMGPYPSGTPIPVSHTWNTKGTYPIKAQAKDVNGVVSQSWGNHVIKISRSKSFSTPFLDFLQHRPQLLLFLERLLSLLN